MSQAPTGQGVPGRWAQHMLRSAAGSKGSLKSLHSNLGPWPRLQVQHEVFPIKPRPLPGVNLPEPVVRNPFVKELRYAPVILIILF